MEQDIKPNLKIRFKRDSEGITGFDHRINFWEPEIKPITFLQRVRESWTNLRFRWLAVATVVSTYLTYYGLNKSIEKEVVEWEMIAGSAGLVAVAALLSSHHFRKFIGPPF